MLAERLGEIRVTDPKKFALFTGRDQMQTLTGLFARQFARPTTRRMAASILSLVDSTVHLFQKHFQIHISKFS